LLNNFLRKKAGKAYKYSLELKKTKMEKDVERNLIGVM